MTQYIKEYENEINKCIVLLNIINVIAIISGRLG